MTTCGFRPESKLAVFKEISVSKFCLGGLSSCGHTVKRLSGKYTFVCKWIKYPAMTSTAISYSRKLQRVQMREKLKNNSPKNNSAICQKTVDQQSKDKQKFIANRQPIVLQGTVVGCMHYLYKIRCRYLQTSNASTCSINTSCLSISSPICLNASSASAEGWGGLGVLGGGGVGVLALGVDALDFAEGARLLLAFKASSSCGHLTYMSKLLRSSFVGRSSTCFLRFC